MQQLSKIFALLGTPNDESWPDVDKLPHFISFEHVDSAVPPTPMSSKPVEEDEELLQFIQVTYNSSTPIGKLFKNYQPPIKVYSIIYVIMWCLQLNPLHRCTAKQALGACYFSMEPEATVPHRLKLPFFATEMPVDQSDDELPPPPVHNFSDSDNDSDNESTLKRQRIN